MRITEQERISIRNIIMELDPNAELYLFGSRTDDNKKGGDIDILVISKKITEKDRRKIKMKLYDAIGEQKIDIVIAPDNSQSFVKIALENGVKI